jgi:hypothetical protein
MFTLDTTIDTIQGIKRAATNQFITDPTLNQTAHAYIDAQTEFAKMMASNAMTLAKYSVETATRGFFFKKD